MKKARLAALLKRGISLIGCHLSLDAHPELGNNAQLAKRLGLVADGALSEDGIGSVGHCRQRDGRRVRPAPRRAAGKKTAAHRPAAR